MEGSIYFNIHIDCEATQRSINNPSLGEHAIKGILDIIEKEQLKATFMVIPGDIVVHKHIYREIEKAGHEIGLHLHPAEQGYSEFLGLHSFEEQVKIINEAVNIFSDVMGRRPISFTPGYFSANDHTFPALIETGFKCGNVSCPTRNLPQCASIWGNSPLDIYYPHRNNRCLRGNLDFVEVPNTVDPDSRMWGGGHPLDLRIELVDAKNHWYTIEKSVRRQIDNNIKVKYLKAVTHNIFEYDNPVNFRRETLIKVISSARKICEDKGYKLVPATIEEIANEYRRVTPLPSEEEIQLKLDTRGRS